VIKRNAKDAERGNAIPLQTHSVCRVGSAGMPWCGDRMSSTPINYVHPSGMAAHRWGRRIIAWGLRRAMRVARMGHKPQAQRIMLRLADVAPDVPVVQLSLARLALDSGDLSTAGRATNAVLTSSMRKAHGTYCRLVALLLELRELGAAKECIENARVAFPSSPRLWILLGELHRYLAKSDDAARCFERAFTLATNTKERLRALVGLAESFADSGRKDDAISASHRMIDLSPYNTVGYVHLVNCQQNVAPSDDAARAMLAMLTSKSTCTGCRMNLHYSLGKLYDSCGRYGEAFAHFTLANGIRAQLSGSFDVELWQKEVEARVSVFDSPLIADMSKHGCQEDFLICIIGMPRSGTTLTEQILSSHPDVMGLGECQEFQRAALGMQMRLNSRHRYPLCCSAMTPDHVSRLAHSIRERLLRTVGQHSRVVTKLPGDCWELGLIKILFPKARIVHCRRHPIDNCLSCYMQNFASIQFSTDLATLAQFYQLYRRIMGHWQRELASGSIFECSYEEMVADPEPLVHSLHDHCGIAFNENWLRFRDCVRRVDTASNWQVRRSIYQSSVQRWVSYAPFLGPLLQLEED